MLAHYPGGEREGARYVPHLDNDPDDPGHREGEPGLRACDRAVTAILYLNPEWEEAHGGCLRVTLEDGRGEADVAPSIGRLVLFDCRRILHEVRPSYAGAVGDDRVDQRLSRRAAHPAKRARRGKRDKRGPRRREESTGREDEKRGAETSDVTAAPRSRRARVDGFAKRFGVHGVC